MSEETNKPMDDVLDSMKGSLQAGLVIGMDEDGNTVIKSSVTNVPFMHWMLNRSIFELALFEKQSKAEDEEQESDK